MKTQITLKTIILILMLGIFTSCEKFEDSDLITGTGELVEKTIQTGDFSNIEVDVDANVYLTQGYHSPLRITGQQNILSLLEIVTENNTLKVNYPAGVYKHEKLEIYVTAPALENVSTARGAQFQSLSAFGSNVMVFQVYGSGKINMQISQASLVRTWITGCGSINLEGNTEMLDVVVNGSGRVLTSNLIAQNSSVVLTGSGKCEVFTSEVLNVNINGSGKVYYTGNPSEIITSLSGSGELKKMQ